MDPTETITGKNTIENVASPNHQIKSSIHIEIKRREYTHRLLLFAAPYPLLHASPWRHFVASPPDQMPPWLADPSGCDMLGHLPLEGARA